jgi:hypothetical protein
MIDTPSIGPNIGGLGPISFVFRWWYLEALEPAPIEVFIC